MGLEPARADELDQAISGVVAVAAHGRREHAVEARAGADRAVDAHVASVLEIERRVVSKPTTLLNGAPPGASLPGRGRRPRRRRRRPSRPMTAAEGSSAAASAGPAVGSSSPRSQPLSISSGGGAVVGLDRRGGGGASGSATTGGSVTPTGSPAAGARAA